MKFSKYISKAVTPVMALFQKQHSCLSNKATTICGYSVCSLRQVPVRHNRGGKSTENKVRLAPPTMCRLTGTDVDGSISAGSTDLPINAFKKLDFPLEKPPPNAIIFFPISLSYKMKSLNFSYSDLKSVYNS